jgi:hypothetical protein
MDSAASVNTFNAIVSLGRCHGVFDLAVWIPQVVNSISTNSAQTSASCDCSVWWT